MKNISILFLLLFLTACTTVNGKVNILPGNINLQHIDSSLLKKCNLPAILPSKALTQAQVEHYWSVDRKNLLLCAKKHGFLADAINFRDAQIQALSPDIKKK